jgi:hypothetical protein
MSLSKRLLRLAGSNADLTDAERATVKEAAALVIGALQRPESAEALALLRELNDALVIPERFQSRVDAVLDRAEEKT